MSSPELQKTSFLSSLSQRFKNLSIQTKFTNTTLPSSNSLAKLTSPNQFINKASTLADTNNAISTQIPDSINTRIVGVASIDIEKTPTLRLITPDNVSLTLAHQDVGVKLARNKGDKDMGLIPESLMDLEDSSVIRPISMELSKEPKSALKAESTMLRIPSLLRGEFSPTDLEARQNTPYGVRKERGVRFATNLIEYEGDKMKQLQARIEQKEIQGSSSVSSMSIKSNANSNVNSIINSPNSSIIRKKNNSPEKITLDGNLREEEDFEFNQSPSNRRFTFDNCPSQQSVIKEAMTPKIGDSHDTFGSQEFTEGNLGILSGSRKISEKKGLDFSLVMPSIKETEKKNMDTKKKTKFSLANLKKLIIICLAFAFSLSFCFAIAVIASAVITYEYKSEDLILWIGKYLHGLLLSLLLFVFLKAQLRISRKDNDLNEMKMYGIDSNHNSKGNQKAYKDTGINILGVLLAVSSGFIMVAIKNFNPELFNYHTYFVLIQIGILVINAFVFWSIFALKNYIAEKKVDKNQADGFFSVPIYKNFMTDLYSARSILSDRTGVSVVAAAAALSPQEGKSKIKEEGIDKYKPKFSFEIVTASKIFGSQVLVIFAFLQFLVIVGLLEFYRIFQKEDKFIPTILVFLFYYLVMEIFTKISSIINNRFKLNMIVYAYYLNTALAAIYFRGALVFITEYRYIWAIIGCKAGYKILIQVVFGVKIDFWKEEFPKKFKSLFTKKPKEIGILEIMKPITRKTLKDIGRLGTYEEKKLSQIEREEIRKLQRMTNIVKKFALKFVLMSINDIFFSAGTLGLIKILPLINLKHFFTDLLFPFPWITEGIYVKGTWIEIAVDAGLLFVIGIIWSFCKAYQGISITQSIREFFGKLSIDYVIATLTIFTGYLFLLQIK